MSSCTSLIWSVPDASTEELSAFTKSIPGAVLYSSGRTHHELLLLEIDSAPRAEGRPEPGFYYVGFKIGTTDEGLRQAKTELEAARVTIIGAADHTVTHSLYVLDPDGNELELYIDVSSSWKTDLSCRSPDKISRTLKNYIIKS